MLCRFAYLLVRRFVDVWVPKRGSRCRASVSYWARVRVLVVTAGAGLGRVAGSGGAAAFDCAAWFDCVSMLVSAYRR